MKTLPGETNLVRETKSFKQGLSIWKALLTIGILLSVGSILNPLEQKLWGSVKESVIPSDLNSTQTKTSEGLVLATLGGFRSIIADIQWLQTMFSWEKEDKEKTIAHIQFTIALDPRPTFFWLNGARIIAYDMRHWGLDKMSTEEQRTEESRLAHLALDFLDLAAQYHPDNHSIPIEKAHIYLNRLQDYEAAAEQYYIAYTEYKEPPYYIGRLYAQILTRIGKYQEAYYFLTTIYNELPSADFYSHKPIVLSRIRSLEKLLKVPHQERFRSQ